MNPVTRQERRKRVAIWRESEALRLLVAGMRQVDIAKELGVSQGAVSFMIRRGLERRAAEEVETVEQARVIYKDRLMLLLQAFLPLATGTFTDSDTGLAAPPDVRSGELALKIIQQLAAVDALALGEAVREGSKVEVNVNLGVVANDQGLRDQIMEQLAEVRRHALVVDGHLIDAGTDLDSLTGRPELDSKPAPPPDWQPPVETLEE